MYLCICKGVREGEVVALSTQDRGTRMRDLQEKLGVCSECGKCAQRALQLLRNPHHPELVTANNH
jgi:bacterioferritin-associated ferredoxin